MSARRLLAGGTLALAAAAALVLVACGDRQPESPVAAASFIRLQVGADVGSTSALAKTDAVHVRLTEGEAVLLDSIVRFSASGSAAIPLSVRLPAATGEVSAAIELTSHGQALFRGSGSGTLQRGVTTTIAVTVSPVVAALVASDSVLLTSLGDTARLGGAAVFPNGDTLTVTGIVWTGDGGAVARVTADGLAIALAEGQAQATASYQGLTHTTRLRVQAVVARVTLSADTLSVYVDSTRTLTAVARDRRGNALTRTIAWQSSNPAVATVDAGGHVHGVAPGSATITASSGGQSASARVTVRRIPVAAVLVQPPAATLLLGQTVRLSATPVDANGQPLAGRAVSFSTSAAGVATVDATGLVQAVGTGNATITATSEGQSGSCAVLVVQPRTAVSPTQVRFAAIYGSPGAPAPQTVSVTNAGTGTLSGLSATVAYGAGQPTGWLTATLGSTTAPTTLTLSAATGLAVGTYTAVVTVASSVAGAGSVPVNVTYVVQAAPVATVRVTPTPDTLLNGSTLQLTATLRDAYGNVLTGRAVTWTSSAPAVATVSASGLVTAVAPGSATITATSEGVSGTAAVTVVQPLVAASPPRLIFTAVKAAGPPTPQLVSVTNAGTGTLSGLSSKVSYNPGGSGWITNSSLSSTTAPATLTVGVDPSNLAPGSTYLATVTVTSSVPNAGSSSVSVAFSVVQPIVAVDTTNETFFPGDTTGHPVNVSNAGSGTLTGLTVQVQYNDTVTNWLSYSLSSSTAPATLTLRLAPNAPYPPYPSSTATVTVSSGVPGAGSVQILVTYVQPIIGMVQEAPTGRRAGSSPAPRESLKQG